MKKKVSRTKGWAPGPKARTPSPRNDCRVLIWVDSAPQRREESKAYVDLRKKLTAGAAAVEHFQQVTLPEFERWHAREFGVLLTEQRTLGADLDEKIVLVDEVEKEQWQGGGTEAAAYQRVLRARARRAAGLADEPEPADDAEDDDDDAEDDQEAALEALFREMVRDLFGMDPESMRPKDCENLKNSFRRNFGGGIPGPDPSPPPGRRRTKEKPATPEQTALETRCKQIYRQLVRRLHPDTGVKPSPQARQLWHDLQDAWERRDLERLELLQAVVELRDGGTEDAFAAVSLDRLRRIVRDLARAWREMQKHRRSLQRHPAFQLTDPVKAKSMEKKIRAEIQADIYDLKRGISEMDRLIARWEKGPPKKKSPRGRSGQEELGF